MEFDTKNPNKMRQKRYVLDYPQSSEVHQSTLQRVPNKIFFDLYLGKWVPIGF